MSFTLVDTHVHFHPFFRLAEFLDAAWANCGLAQCRAPICLLLAQIAEGDTLRLIREQVGSLSPHWQVANGSPGTMVFERAGTPLVITVSGRQLKSREGLEVLALATEAELANGGTLVDTVASINDVGGVAVLPWAFGKWWFRRGRVLTGLMSRDDVPFLLGDNGCRPAGGGTPRPLQAARACGIPVIAGSDPLPLPGQVNRVGSLGSLLHGTIDLDDPRGWIQTRLRSLATSPTTCGKHRTLVEFFSDQVRLRLPK